MVIFGRSIGDSPEDGGGGGGKTKKNIPSMNIEFRINDNIEVEEMLQNAVLTKSWKASGSEVPQVADTFNATVRITCKYKCALNILKLERN